MNTSNEFRKNLSVDVPIFMKNDRKISVNEEMKMYAEKTAQPSRTKKLSKRAKRLFKTLAAAGFLTGILAGPIAKYKSYADIEAEGDAATIEEIMKNEELLEKIGVSSENLNKYLEYDSALENGDISKSEMKEMPNNLYELEKDILDDKVSKATGMPKEDIVAYEGNDQIAIKRGTSMENATTEYAYQKDSIGSIAFEGWASYLNLDGKSISEEVKNSIENIASIQTYANELKGKNIEEIDYNNVESRCKEEMENIAGILGKDYVVEKNVLKTEQIEKSQTKNETAKTDREDDEMEL